MRRAGITVTSRSLRYRVERVLFEDGSSHEIPVQREKGIDLRLGLDVVRMARHGELDVAVIFSQDQDLAEAAREVRDIARSEGRWLKVVSLSRMARMQRQLEGSLGPIGFAWTAGSTIPVSIRGIIVRVFGRNELVAR